MFDVVQRARAGDLASIRQIVGALYLAAMGGSAVEQNLADAAVWAGEAAIRGDRSDVLALIQILFTRYSHDGDITSAGLGVAVVELMADEDEEMAADLLPMISKLDGDKAGPVLEAAKAIRVELLKK